MTRAGLVGLVAIAGIGCGGDGSSGGAGSVSGGAGTIGGIAFTPRSAATALFTEPLNIGTIGDVYITDAPDTCAQFTTATEPANFFTIALYHRSGVNQFQPPSQTGDYVITADDASPGLIAGVDFQPPRDADGGYDISNADSGTVTLTSLGGGMHFKGHYDIGFGAVRFSGTFDAPYCAAASDTTKK